MTTIFEGVATVSDSLRLQVASEEATTDLFERMLLGRAPVPAEFDRAVAVWWLAESGRQKYLSTLLLMSQDTVDTRSLPLSIYGLARLARLPDARARLQQLSRSNLWYARVNVPAFLAIVNDTAARSLLRELPLLQSRDGRGFVSRALRAPARSDLAGRFPCLAGDKRDPGATSCASP